MSESITIRLELPPAELRGNQRGHTRHKGDIVKAARQTAWKLGLAAKGDWVAPPIAVLSMFFHFPDKRRRDILNYAAGMKSAIDGLVDAGLMVDDDAAHMEIGELRAVLGSNDPRCDILIERW